MSPTPRETLALFGPRGSRVRVLVHDATTVRVQWYDGVKGKKKPRAKDFDNTPEGRRTAKAWAKGFAEERTLPKAAGPITLREMWEAYVEAEAHLRTRSKDLYGEQWLYWERMWGKDFMAALTTLRMMDQFRAALVKRKLGVNTIGKIIQAVKRCYRWARGRELIPANPLAEYVYKVSRDERPESPPEYSPDEYRKIMARFNPEDGRTWRPFVGLTICGEQGVRENAACHLAWPDIDLETETITWRAKWDKLGREWSQPMRPATRAVLEIALMHREALGYTGPWVLWAGNSLKRGGDVPYTPDALIKALRTAEKRTGVPYVKGRGPHGLRRLLATNVAEVTGDPIVAMRAIGDRDVKMANRYIKKRDETVREAFALLDQTPSRGKEK